MRLNNTITNKIYSKNGQYIVVLIIFFTLSLPVKASLTTPLKKVGEGDMSWMFIDIYRATLFTEKGTYQASNYPQALSITYLKNINKNKLLDATKDQWLLQNFDAVKVEHWLKTLSQIWPDIQTNDTLLFYVSENKQGTFYYNERQIGSISDRELSVAFLAIWLSDKTSQPKLRRQLLGI
jgi:hypothetical protein